MRNSVVLLVAILIGCTGREVKLGPEWAPLEQVRESKVMSAGLSGAGARALGDTVYVRSIEEFEEHLPVGAVRDSVLLHEQVHAVRQGEKGLLSWLASYGTSSDFAWEEEQRGWYAQIKHLQSRGLRVNPLLVAKSLADYRGPWGSMVSEEEALAWVDAVLAGRWKPGTE